MWCSANLPLSAFSFVASLAVTCLTIVLCAWSQTPLGCTLGLTVLNLFTCGISMPEGQVRALLAKGAAVVLPFSCIFAVACLLLEEHPGAARYWDIYYCAIAWLVALNLLIANRHIVPDTTRNFWKASIWIWALLGTVSWLAWAYVQNKRPEFYAGALICAAVLVAGKKFVRLSFLGIQAVNTALLLVIGLPIVDVCVYSRGTRQMAAEELKRFATYSAALTNPAAFQRWWNYFSIEQCGAMLNRVLIIDQSANPPYRLRPNSKGTLINSEISINSRGFRGTEIPEVKGDAYRIVALGESSTFGLTINAGEKPWPELLEDSIRTRLHPERPIEVINAGVPGATLLDNLARFQADILPLKPDMVISYHGYNGFPWILEGLAPVHGKQPPIHQERPLRLLADCEYRLKLGRYLRKESHPLLSQPATLRDPMQTQYAKAYEQLIEICRTNHICLVLASFSMAVNSQTRPEVIEFFRHPFPGVYSQIRACAAHNDLLLKLQQLHPEVQVVDTRPALDGAYDKFLDLMHPAEAGDRQLAENIFMGLSPILEGERGRKVLLAPEMISRGVGQ